MEYRKISPDELTPALFASFDRRQEVKKCWRKAAGEWILIDHPFVEQWDEADYRYVVKCLQNTIATGGAVFGAFQDGELKGFASVENSLFGSDGQYLQLSSLHASADCRGQGIGRVLFFEAAREAALLGAEKLYISSHSAEETQAFYRSVGCREAVEVNAALAAAEPCDCQLEYDLYQS